MCVGAVKSGRGGAPWDGEGAWVWTSFTVLNLAPRCAAGRVNGGGREVGCSCQAFTARNPVVDASWAPALPSGQFSQANWANFRR